MTFVTLIFLIALALLVATWSQYRGTGFWFAFAWSLLLSPVIGVLLVLLRRPRARTLVRGGIAEPMVDPGAPRPIFCAVMIVGITLLIATLAGCDDRPPGVCAAMVKSYEECRNDPICWDQRGQWGSVGYMHDLDQCYARIARGKP